MFRYLFTLLLLGGLATSVPAQTSSTPCADVVKKHLAALDDHLDLDFGQMKCLREKAMTFCDRNQQNPPANAQQWQDRKDKLRKALLECLDQPQRIRVTTVYRNKQDERARRNILQAFLEEFGDDIIIIKKR